MQSLNTVVHYEMRADLLSVNNIDSACSFILYIIFPRDGNFEGIVGVTGVFTS